MTYPDPTPPEYDPEDGWWVDSDYRRKQRSLAPNGRNTRASETPVQGRPRLPFSYKPKRKIGFRR